MAEKQQAPHDSPRPASLPLKPEPAGDGFPADTDVSNPPRNSDQASGENKEPDD